MTEFRGKVAVVTGAGSGIGAALAAALSAADAKVVVTDIDAAAARAVAAQLNAQGRPALAVEADVSHPGTMEALAESTWRHFGACHLLFNNAGVSLTGPLWENNATDIERLFAVNIQGVVNGIRAFLPRLIAQGTGGHIVNTASMGGLVPLKGFGAYAASKYAVLGLSEVLALELAAHKIAVSVLCPGMVDTRIHLSDPNGPQDGKHQAGESPGKISAAFDPAFLRVIAPENAAACVLSALRSKARYIVTHREWLPLLQERHDRIQQAFSRHESTPR